MARAVFLYLVLVCLVLLSLAPAGAAEKVVPGDWDYCSTTSPCGRNVGDCDTDAECEAGLSCEKDVGPDYGYAKGVDVCIGQPVSSNTNGNSQSNNTKVFGGGVSNNANSGAQGNIGTNNGSSRSACNPFLNPECVNGLGYGTSGDTDDHSTATGTCKFSLGHPAYCLSCGPCGEGEGSCDPGLGQCAPGLVCIDHVCKRPK